MESATETAPPREAPPEGPRFGLATATFVVVSSMIGTGVLTTSGFTVYFVGSNQLMLVLWVVGGVLALCGALTLCELSAALPRSGGDYVFLSEAYGPLAAFLSGWVSFLIGFGGPIAASASAAATYLLAPLRLGGTSAAVTQPAVASVAIVVIGVVHCLGRGSTIRAQAGMTTLKIGILATLAVAGLAAGWGRWENLADRRCPRASSSPWPRRWSTFRMPIPAGTRRRTWPERSLAGTGVLTAAVFYERPIVSAISLLSIAVGVPVYYVGRFAAWRR